jgi:hypothetical protein
MTFLRRPTAAFVAALRALDVELRDGRLNWTLAVVAAVFAAYVAMCLKTVVAPPWPHRYGDFHALWASAVVVHDGAAALNYDNDALQVRQAALGMPVNENNPFPFPPTFLLMLAPLGGLGRGAAFALFMGATFAGYLWAITGGRRRDWPSLVGALVAPATGITLISGQTGFLSGGLMVGGLRLARTHPLVAGALLGLLAYKPQLGLLVPVALASAGLWRVFAAACATVLLSVAASSAVFGARIWLTWFASLQAYSRFHPIDHLMPTIAANLRMAGAPASAAIAAQALVGFCVAAVVWRAFRNGVSPRAGALLVIGTFLATPHALNYDMPMTTAAVTWYLTERVRATDSLFLSEAIVLSLALVLPFAMLALGENGPPISWAPQLWLFSLIAVDPYGRQNANRLEERRRIALDGGRDCAADDPDAEAARRERPFASGVDRAA